MKRQLIVNADDCNLTPGVTRAILKCHDEGILSSTTFMINLPIWPETVAEIKKRPGLGLGIHLNITLGYSVCIESQIQSLLNDGAFKKRGEQLSSFPDAQEVENEYSEQIEKFRKVFGVLPTHCDTHHQIHDHPFFYRVLQKVADKFSLPVRRSQCSKKKDSNPFEKTTDYFFGNLDAKHHWKQEPLEVILSHIPEGVSEIMCHPGIHDKDLEQITSFTVGREAEFALFSNPKYRPLVKDTGVQLATFKSLHRQES